MINNNKTNVDKTLEKNNVLKTLAHWIDAFNNKDSKALFAIYDSESTYLNPHDPMLKGIEQVKPWYEKNFPLMKGTLKYKEEIVTIDGNMAVIVLKFYLKPLVKNDGEEPFKGRAILVFRKSKEGKWLLLFDMDNSPSDVLVKDFD